MKEGFGEDEIDEEGEEDQMLVNGVRIHLNSNGMKLSRAERRKYSKLRSFLFKLCINLS